MICKICQNNSEHFDVALVLNKYMVDYFRCHACGLIQTEDAYWLEEAYSSAIADSDIGLVGRNVQLARQTKILIDCLFHKGASFVDYGGGYGIFVRLMRDAGFNFFRQDKYCENLFAKGFDVIPGESRTFDLLTAFEVFEHLASPAEELDKMLCLSRNVLFTTCVIPFELPPKLSEWWYYALHCGQHITIYTKKSLTILAERNKLFFNSHGNTHLFSERPIPQWLFGLLFKPRVDRLIALIRPRRASLTSEDYFKLTGRIPT